MEECLSVNRDFEANVAPDQDSLHQQVACSEETSPNMAVSRHQTALLITEESLVFRTSQEKAIEGKEGGKGGVDQRIHLHSIVVKVALAQLQVLRVHELDSVVEDDVLGAEIGIANHYQLEVLHQGEAWRHIIC